MRSVGVKRAVSACLLLLLLGLISLHGVDGQVQGEELESVDHPGEAPIQNGESEEKAAAAAEVLKIEAEVTDLEARVKRLREAKPDPVLKQAVDAALSAEEELLKDKDAETKWNQTVMKLTKSSEMWKNVSAAEDAMQANMSAEALVKGDSIEADTERLEHLRSALEHTQQNAQTSLLSDAILHASKSAREALEQLREYQHERDSTKEEFIASLRAIATLMRRYANESKESTPTSGDVAHATHAQIETKQALARIQRERLLDLNSSIVEQKHLLEERHEELDRITQSQTPDNFTTPSAHTRELRAKERLLQKMVENLEANVSKASAELAAERERSNALAKEKSDMENGPEREANEKLARAKARLANASLTVRKATVLESQLRESAEEASLVENAERKKAVAKLEARLTSAKEQLTLAKEKLEGEIKAEEASKAAGEAAETTEKALLNAEEANFEAKAREVQATEVDSKAENTDSIAPWDDNQDAGQDSKSRVAHHVRNIVGKLLWSEGHSAAAQQASKEIVDTVHKLLASHKDLAQTKKMQNEIETQEARLRASQSTEHIDAKIKSVQETMPKQSGQNARFKSMGMMRQGALAKPKEVQMKTISKGPASMGKLPRVAKKETDATPTLQVVPRHCFDGEKNKGEDGPDCGGSCPRICGEHPSAIMHDNSDKNVFHVVSKMDHPDLYPTQTRHPLIVDHLVTKAGKSSAKKALKTSSLIEERKIVDQASRIIRRHHHLRRINRLSKKLQRHLAKP